MHEDCRHFHVLCFSPRHFVLLCAFGNREAESWKEEQ
jgi:hypothetical protein